MPKTWVFQSDSNENVTYTTTLREDGTRSCTCHGAKQLANGSISCKHTRLIDQGLADQQAIKVSGNSAAQVLGQISSFIKAAGNVGGYAVAMPDFDDIDKMIKLPEESSTEVSGLLPQLLTPIEIKDAAKYLKDDKWGAQEKIDGKRIMLRVYQVNGGGFEVMATNRKGKPCDIPDDVRVAAAQSVETDCTIDGELIESEGMFYAFDFIGENGTDEPYVKRHERLKFMLGTADKECIRVVPLAASTLAKSMMFAQLTKNQREGIVFKKLSAKYTPGRGPNQLKCKFYAAVTCMVVSHSKEKSKSTGTVKSSITLGVFADQKGKKNQAGKMVHVGNCTVPAGWELPPVNSLVEIRYLYYYKGGCLYQPVYLNPRDDVGADCVANLKCKSEDGGSLEMDAEDEVAEVAPKSPVKAHTSGFRRVLWKE